MYYHGKSADGSTPQPGHLTGPPAIGRAAAESLRPSSVKAQERNMSYRVMNSNFVQQTCRAMGKKGDNFTGPTIDPAEAAAQALIDSCDVDGDGQLDIGEIIKALMNRPHLLQVRTAL
mgnify:CR=1 FL=1